MAYMEYSFETGHGIQREGTGYYEWWGHSFNPTSSTVLGANTWDYWADHAFSALISAWNPTNVFNLSGMQQGQEVVMAVLVLGCETSDSGVLSINIKDPDGTIVYSAQYSLGTGYEYWFAWLGIGIKSGSGQEIWKNGTYTANYTIGSLSGSISFTVSNFPSATVGNRSLWVEGNYLCFCAYEGAWKIKCMTDGTNYGTVGTAYSGSTWLETDGKIAYVDEYGDKRMTKMGDRYGYGGWSSEIPSAPGSNYAGSIWDCNDNNDTYLMIISNNGYKYRIGAGYASIGDYQ